MYVYLIVIIIVMIIIIILNGNRGCITDVTGRAVLTNVSYNR